VPRRRGSCSRERSVSACTVTGPLPGRDAGAVADVGSGPWLDRAGGTEPDTGAEADRDDITFGLETFCSRLESQPPLPRAPPPPYAIVESPLAYAAVHALDDGGVRIVITVHGHRHPHPRA